MKTLKIISAGLLLIIMISNTANGQRIRNQARFNEEDRKEFRSNHLNLNEEQKAQVANLREARLEANKERREKLASLRQQLRLEKETDLNKINAIVDEMAMLRAEIEKENLKFRHELSTLLTDDQKQMLNTREKRERRLESRRIHRPRARLRNN
jgi:Spy/CpxP family protein refolding chaperone